MILPNKIINSNECIVSKTVYILDTLYYKKYPMSANELYDEIQTYFNDLSDYIIALDILYVLGKINYNKKLGVIELC